MILITEGLQLDYYLNTDDDKKSEVKLLLNKKKYTVKDTSLSYRQVNSLDSDNMISKQRSSAIGWRKFSFIDLVYLHTISELRKFGVENSKLQELKSDFYNKKGDLNFSEVDHVLLLVMGAVKISLLIDKDGHSYFVDMNNQTLIDETQDSYLYVNFNEIVRKVWGITYGNANKIPDYKSWVDVLIESNSSEEYVSKEKEILNILRNKNYSVITIKKKGNDVFNIYGEVSNQSEGMSEIELLKLMNKKDFTDISVTKRDGKIVSYKYSDIYKL